MKSKDKETLKVVFCDNHHLLVEKPSGFLTQSEDRENLQSSAQEWIKKKYEKPGKVFLHPIHRLDKEVSGLVLFARTSKALSRLQQQMRERKIERIYLAEVEGSLKAKQGELIHFLSHGSHRALLSEKEGKKAVLTYRVIEEKEKSSFVEIHLQTGRYHQIRAQFSAIGHPICGDEKYGGVKRERIHLHHIQMEWEHPITKEKMVFRSKIPLFI